jgi:hypothetical protein
MDGWAGLSLAPEVMPSPIRHSLSQAEDVNIVNGVHELGHKWCAYPRQPCTHYDGFRPVSLCTYPLNLATSGPRRNQHLGTCRRTDACLPACLPATAGTRLRSGCPAAPITPSATGTTGCRP